MLTTPQDPGQFPSLCWSVSSFGKWENDFPSRLLGGPKEVMRSNGNN